MVEPQTLLIVPKTSKCNANCKFCITYNLQGLEGFETIREESLVYAKLEAVAKFSKSIGVVDANITGGSEPLTAEPNDLIRITRTMSDCFGRVNLYTNGIELLKKVNAKELVTLLADAGLTNVTISRAHYTDKTNKEIMRLSKDYDFKKVVRTCDESNLDLKLSCLLTREGIGTKEDVKDYINVAKENGVKKIIFRELLKVNENNTQGTWIKENITPISLVKELMEEARAHQFRGIWNQLIWVYDGIGITMWPDGSRKDTINKGDLIYMPDNHLYASWITKASRIM